jgi:hypothetical protein
MYDVCMYECIYVTVCSLTPGKGVVHVAYCFSRWHGTSSRNARFIAEHGFDERLANMHGLYGAGSYFAVQSCKSHQYSRDYKDSPNHVMMLCRVIMGAPHCTKSPHKTERRPPDNPQTPGRPFDSIFAKTGAVRTPSGHVQAHHEYIVFSSAQVNTRSCTTHHGSFSTTT